MLDSIVFYSLFRYDKKSTSTPTRGLLRESSHSLRFKLEYIHSHHGAAILYMTQKHTCAFVCLLILYCMYLMAYFASCL